MNDNGRSRHTPVLCPRRCPRQGDDVSDGHTIDVGYVHVLNDDRTCRENCPHPDHDPERLAARGNGGQAGET